MTLKQIHSMFTTGSYWTAANTYSEAANGGRHVVQRKATEIVWMNERGGKSYMKLPRASQVIDAKDGFMSFRLFTTEEETKYRKPDAILATLTLTRVSQ